MPALAHDFSCHCYADEVQLLLSFPPVDTHVSAQIAACLADMSSWRAAHHLKLNPWKTELPYIPGDTSPHLRSCNLLGELLVKAIVLFSYCSLQSCRFLIYNIKRIWSRYLFSLSSSKDWTNSAHPWLGFPWIPSNPCNWSRMQLLYLFLISHITPLKHWCLPIKSKNRPSHLLEGARRTLFSTPLFPSYSHSSTWPTVLQDIRKACIKAFFFGLLIAVQTAEVPAAFNWIMKT